MGYDPKPDLDYARQVHQSGQLEKARSLYLQILKAVPAHGDTLQLLGVTYSQADEHGRAVDYIGRAIELVPDNANFHYNQAVALQRLRRTQAALAGFQRAIRLNPDHAAAHAGRGNALLELGQWEAAIASYRAAIAARPDHAEAHGNLGVALKELGQLQAAARSFEQAVACKPDHADAWSNRGVVLNELNQVEAAAASCGRAARLRPDHADAHANWAIALQKGRRLPEAIAAYERAIALRPEHGEAWLNRGSALLELRRAGDALASYGRALLIRPDSAEAHSNRGNVLLELWQPEAAAASYVAAITLRPDYVEAYANLGMALQDLKGLALAVRCFARALILNPEQEFLAGKLAHAKRRLCDWDGMEPLSQALKTGIEQGRRVISPFLLLSLTDDEALHHGCAEIWERARRRSRQSLGSIARRAPAARIRVGYYSADFQNHATSYLMAGVFEAHDRAQFETFGFTFGPDVQDEMRTRVAGAFEHFMDVRAKSDREVARLSRDLGIDIAVDLKGYTKDARSGMFARRCAPLQVNYLGYPGTMAAEYIDYLLADRFVIPAADQRRYSEKIVTLPDSYQPNDGARAPARPRRFQRKSFGLPEKGFVYSCFNNSYKITPEIFDIWMRILRRVPGSVLWLFEANVDVADNLRREAEKRGVQRSRLVFAGPLPLRDHLDRSGLADLFLDTLPYNGHTTASDALFAGVPVLTCQGRSFASRVAASLLHAVGLKDMIVPSLRDYEALAIRLAEEPAWLNGIKARLQINLPKLPLFDTARTTRHLESAYRTMMERHHAGLAPAAFEVPG